MPYFLAQLLNHFGHLFPFLLQSRSFSLPIYAANHEYSELQGISALEWRISPVNREYTVCDTYPAQLMVPMALSDPQLVDAAEFRSRGRLPGAVRQTVRGAVRGAECGGVSEAVLEWCDKMG